MKSRAAAPLVALLIASWPVRARAQEAISFDAPRLLVSPDGGVRWRADAGVCLTEPAFEKIDNELTNYQRKDAIATQSKTNFFWAGAVVGGISAALLVGLIAIAAHGH